MNNRFLPFAIVLNLVLMGSGCAKTPDYWPTDGWRTSPPEAQGMDSETLSKLLEFIREHDMHMHSVTIIRHGYIVFDAYFWPASPSTLHDIASCTKSLTSTLVGIAQDKGYLDIDKTMLSYFPDRTVRNLDAEKQKITVKNLLTMTSGMKCVNVPTEVTLNEMLQSPDYVQFALDLPVTAEPGSKWEYASCGSHLLGAIVANSTGMSEEEFCRKNLFEPLGIDTFYWPRDRQGYNHGWGDLRMRPLDMAKLGFLYLHKGLWDSRRILSSNYVRKATKTRTKFESGEGYGYQWWTYKFGSYYAKGRGGQRIFMAPVLDLIVVTTAGNSAAESDLYEPMLGQVILPAVKKMGRGSLPENPDAFARLEAGIKEAGEPPLPEPVPTLPQTAYDVSGKAWALDSNLVGWETLKLEFDNGSNEAFITLMVNGRTNRFPVGLDGVPRIATGESFAADSRYAGQDVALNGSWSSDTFAIDFNTIGVIERGTIAFHFIADTVGIELFEKTFIGAPVTFTGKLKE
ncbi:serine hydrolase [bacterium]|nr:serine hydrolase [bacterium]